MPKSWSTPFKHLALLAMLALVLVPPVGRLVQAAPRVSQPLAPASPAMSLAPTGSHGEHCASMADEADDRGDASIVLPGDDCAYCPILAALALPTLQTSVLPPLLWSAPRDERGMVGEPAQAVITGLGARGPPLAI